MAASHGYLVYLLRANTTHRPRELQRLSSMGDANVDLLSALVEVINKLGSGYHKDEKMAEGYRIKAVKRTGLSLEIKINKGPEGAPGETYDIDTNVSTETTERQALLSGLRAQFVIPQDSYYGLLFVERVGRRHLKELIYQKSILPVAQASGVVIRVESFAEAEDWRKELEAHTIYRVSQLLKATNSAADASTPMDSTVRIAVEGGLIRTVGERIKALIPGRQHRYERDLDNLSSMAALGERRRVAEAGAFAIQDEREYQRLSQLVAQGGPAPDEDLQQALAGAVPLRPGPELIHKRWEITTGDGRPERTFVVEGDAVPQFVYEMGLRRATDGALRNTWLDHADQILRNRGVTLPAGWAGQAVRAPQ